MVVGQRVRKQSTLSTNEIDSLVSSTAMLLYVPS